MESGCYSVLLAGTVPALASSLAVVAIFQVRLSVVVVVSSLLLPTSSSLFQIAGVILACCLARTVSADNSYDQYELRNYWGPLQMADLGLSQESGLTQTQWQGKSVMDSLGHLLQLEADLLSCCHQHASLPVVVYFVMLCLLQKIMSSSV